MPVKPMLWDYAGGRGPIIVGQAPSRSSDGMPPFHGRSGVRLARILGLEWPALAMSFRFANLLSRWPGYTGGNGHGRPDGRRRHGGDEFDPTSDEALIAAGRLLVASKGAVLVLCGRGVATAFGLPRRFPILTWRVMGGSTVGVLPHPSGVNHWWNAAGSEERARRFLSEALRMSRRQEQRRAS